jgi:hypothetical protein
MILRLILFLLVMTSISSYANEEINTCCKDLKGFEKIILMFELSSNILISNSSNNVENKKLKLELSHARKEYNHLLKICPEYKESATVSKLNNSKLNKLTRGKLDLDYKLELRDLTNPISVMGQVQTAERDSNFMAKFYLGKIEKDYLNSLQIECSYKSSADEVNNCLDEAKEIAREKYVDYIRNHSVEEIYANVHELSDYQFKKASCTSVRNAIVLRKFYLSKNLESGMDFLKTYSSQWDPQSRGGFKQITDILMEFGYRQKELYENERLEGEGEAGKGGVAFNEMFYSMQDYELGLKDPRGICRDLTLFQIKVAEALGINKENGFRSFAKAYRSGNQYHVSMLIHNNKEKKSVHFNYGYTSQSLKGEDGAASVEFKDTMYDQSLMYRLHEHSTGEKFKTVSSIPSEYAKLAIDMSGFDLKLLEPGAIKRSNIFKQNIDLEGDKDFSLFLGKTPNGDQVFGAVYSNDYLQESHYPGKYALMLNNRTSIQGASSRNNVNSNHLFGIFEQKISTKDHELLKEKIYGKIDLAFIGIVDIIFTQKSDISNPVSAYVQNKNPLHFNPAGEFITQLRAYLKTKGKLGEIELKMIADFRPGTNDLSDQSWIETFSPYLQHLLISADGRAFLGKTFMGRTYLKAAAGVILDNLGPRATASLGIGGEKYSLSLEMASRLSDSTPIIKEGSAKRVSATISSSPFESAWLHFFLQGVYYPDQIYQSGITSGDMQLSRPPMVNIGINGKF